ncbi:MAG: GNAT family N-acetyltransferase [Fibrobacteres bacterium]|nr:GNAT family N-acetyltransferase [Fibrobacterota bacterium]
MPLQVKIADRAGEFEQIGKLNYRTFVEEIPQHHPNEEQCLIDKFHGENLYLVCLDGESVVGMVALRDRRPFSLDAKLPDLDAYLPPGARAVEIRLLSVLPERRRGPAFGLLMKALLARCLEMDYDVGLISGRLENAGLYAKFGFRPFGPKVGSDGAWYQPMRIDKATLNGKLGVLPAAARTVNLLPGPVAHAPSVRAALAGPVESHRSAAYAERLARVKSMLLSMTGAANVQVLMGTGTMANDVVAARLSLRPGRGLILSNGEFGERLVRHAEGFSLRHEVLRQPWGEALDPGRVAQRLLKYGGFDWVWAVHCETSTGVLNPVEALREACFAGGAGLNLDCISSLGTVPVDLSGIDLASGVSGKGLGGFTGMAMVFHRLPAERGEAPLPRYLDLAAYASEGGLPYSGSSNLLAALEAALRDRRGGAFLRRLTDLSGKVRQRLEQERIPVLAAAASASPAVFTLMAPSEIPSLDAGRALESQGILLNYQSGYLAERNWLQICLMADHPDADVDFALERIAAVLR